MAPPLLYRVYYFRLIAALLAACLAWLASRVIPSGTFNENVSATYKDNLNISGAGDNTTIAGNLSFSSCSNLWVQALHCYGVTMISCNLANVFCSVDGIPSQHAVALFYCTGFDQAGTLYNGASGLLTYQSSGEILSGADFVSNLTSVATSTYSNVEAVGSQFCTSVNYDFTTQQYGCMNAYGCYYQNGIARYANNRGGKVMIDGSYSCTSQSVSCPRYRDAKRAFVKRSVTKRQLSAS